MRSGFLLALAAALLGGACVPRVPPQRLAERAKVAVAWVVDPSYAGAPFAPPQALRQAVTAALDERNLEVVEVPLEVVQGQRLSDARFEALKRAAAQAPFVLLVEQRVQFFSQLDGRYRWEVGTTLTAARADGASARDPFEVPVILLFDHEKETAALGAAAADVATRVGVLMDGVLAGATAPRAQRGLPRGVYFVMVDRFANGDGRNDGAVDPADPQAFHGGDLQGLIERLDWIAALGFDTVWVSPVFAMRTTKWNGHGAYHGYWTWDLSALEPRFGDELLLARLRHELDRRQMKLVLDLVLNHVGPDAPVIAQRPEWFHRRGGVTDWTDPVQLTTHDVHGLSDLATERPDVFAHLLGAARRWLPGRPA